MRWRLSNLIGEYQALTGERLSYRDIAAGAGLSVFTVATMVRGETQRPDLGTMNAILSFFNSKGMGLQTSDLLEWVEEETPVRGA